jgi:hypothetical protein
MVEIKGFTIEAAKTVEAAVKAVYCGIILIVLIIIG